VGVALNSRPLVPNHFLKSAHELEYEEERSTFEKD
jgi:hypothetical protein